ncbi:MAG: four helix bundle protein [Oscillospiraceae bacterium]|nr:four helix bundle protein [Oscillospiraceae bacterium]
MAENRLVDISTELAVRILKLTGEIKGHSSLFNQMERSGTSIGANIREAKYAHGKADFIAKLQISLKECYETEYWLEIAQRAGVLSEKTAAPILHDCGVIRRMLIASINTVKKQRA